MLFTQSARLYAETDYSNLQLEDINPFRDGPFLSVIDLNWTSIISEKFHTLVCNTLNYSVERDPATQKWIFTHKKEVKYLGDDHSEISWTRQGLSLVGQGILIIPLAGVELVFNTLTAPLALLWNAGVCAGLKLDDMRTGEKNFDRRFDEWTSWNGVPERKKTT